ncbi:aldose epimerase family protein [Thalassotalea sp. ND16A]|uniref:aldose epimerase family protein n=1 Tax=Thalassotalea sp. ND16A TaxID=1535422 RepID=UPI00051DA74D|nr:aldose epimerase family protein [Thalassotalea sp. ND16A]KGJ92452.1 Aldose 1-epimerase [Thalassotalea sp. ND16A]
MVTVNPALATVLLRSLVLSNDNGMSVEIINFGARIKSIKFPLNGKPTEMTLGYASAAEYLTDDFYLGATCGRVCNRIAGGKFRLAGQLYQLPLNDGNNCLHGGDNNFSMRYWQIDKQSQSAVTLSLISTDGDQGFPGTVKLALTYQLSADNQLSIQYLANTDLATPVNLTNHTYFNLGESDCQSLSLQMQSSQYVESDSDNIPTGNIVALKDTDYDFNEPATIGQRQSHTEDKSLQHKHGYDHCFVLDKVAYAQPNAVLTSHKNQVKLSVYTDQPAIQLYTGFYLSKQFNSYQGVCLEAQNYPDAINHDHFPCSVLTPDKSYQRNIVFAFESVNSAS